jgi:hypothetical protein
MTEKLWIAGGTALVVAAVMFGLLVTPPAVVAQPTNLAPFQTNIAVTTTAKMAAVAANPTRKGLMLCNTGTAIVYASFGTVTPTTTTGITLAVPPAVNACLDLMPYMGPNIAMGAQINVIGAAAGSAVALEF